MSSPGGVAAEGYAIGWVLSEHAVTAVVPKGNGCYSACAMGFLGAKNYVVEGILAFHSSYTEDLSIGTMSALRAGQYFGAKRTIYFMTNGFSPVLSMIMAFGTSPSVFFVFTSTEELQHFFVRGPEGEDYLWRYTHYDPLNDLPEDYVSTHLWDSATMQEYIVAQRREAYGQ